MNSHASLWVKKLGIPAAGIVLLAGLFWGFNMVRSFKANQAAQKHYAAITEEKLPTFAAFAIKDIYAGELADPDFSSIPNNPRIVEAIREATRQGINFAGHYTIASWGCGTACQNHAIIDRKTGAIVEYGFVSSHEIEFKPWSRLVIANPKDRIRETALPEIVMPEYYVLDQKNDLVFIAKHSLFRDAVMCTRTLNIRALKLGTMEIKEFSPCTIDEGYVAIDITPETSVNFTNQGTVFPKGDAVAFRYLSFGVPAEVTLAFNGASRCFSATEGAYPCLERPIKKDFRASLEGFRSKDTVTVWLLELDR